MHQTRSSLSFRILRLLGNPVACRVSNSHPSFLTDPIDPPSKKSVLKSASPALALLSSQHSAPLNAHKDDAPGSRPSSSYGIRSQPSGDFTSSDSELLGKEGGRKDKSRVTFADPVRDSWEKDELKPQAEVGPSGRTGGSGASDRVEKGAEGLAKANGPSVFGSLEGDSLDLLGFGSVAGAPKTGRRGRPPVSDVGTTGQLEFGSPATHPASSLRTSEQRMLKEDAKQGNRTDKILPKQESTDWGDADDSLAMLPDGSGAASKKAISESPPRGNGPLAPQQHPKPVSAYEEKAGGFGPEPTVASSREVTGPRDTLQTAKETAAPDLGGYTPSFLNGTGRTRRTGVGLGRRPPSPLVPDTSLRTDSDARKRPMGGFRTETDAQSRPMKPIRTDADALKRPMSADHARTGPQLGSALGSRPASADVFRDARVPLSSESGNGAPYSIGIPKADAQRGAGFASKSTGGGVAKSGVGNESADDEPFLRPAEGRSGETSGRGYERAEKEFLGRPGSAGGSLRGRDRDNSPVDQVSCFVVKTSRRYCGRCKTMLEKRSDARTLHRVSCERRIFKSHDSQSTLFGSCQTFFLDVFGTSAPLP